MTTQTEQPNPNTEQQDVLNLEELPSMEELLQQEETPTFAEGGIVTGKVVEKRDHGVLVDIGYKAVFVTVAVGGQVFARVTTGVVAGVVPVRGSVTVKLDV